MSNRDSKYGGIHLKFTKPVITNDMTNGIKIHRLLLATGTNGHGEPRFDHDWCGTYFARTVNHVGHSLQRRLKQ